MQGLEQFGGGGRAVSRAQFPGGETLHDLIDRAPHKISDEEYRETAEALLEYLPALGGEYFKDVGALYARLAGQELVVRREDPRALINFMEGDEALALRQEGEAHYANAAKWKYEEGTRGLENAFLEGRTHLNGAVMVMGFEPRHAVSHALSNENESVTLPGGRVIDRTNVVSLEGEIKKEDVRFIIMRLLAEHVPEGELTEDELERLSASHDTRGPRYIFRGALFNAAPVQSVH